MPITVYHIPVCPFSQRLEILLELKGKRDEVSFETVDITKPRSPDLLELSHGNTALPLAVTPDGTALNESLVLLNYLEDVFPEPAIRRADPIERAIENLMVAMESPFSWSGYKLVMNQCVDKREELVTHYVAQHAALDQFLRRRSRGKGPWLFENFGWAEAVFTPFFRRFAFVAYYEDVDIPDGAQFQRVREWRKACLDHPSAQQVSDEEVIKAYYDYSRNAGNGALPPGRRVSSFALSPSWRERPYPPKDKYGAPASDEELGLH